MTFAGKLALGLALALTLAGTALERTRAEESGPYKLGAKVADATVKDLSGKEVKLASLAGKIVVLNFYSLKCAICNAEAPRLEKEIWQRYKDRGVVVVGISRTAAEAEKFRDKHALSYTLWADRDAELFDRFVDQAIPWNAVIDRDGTLRYTKTGFEPGEITKVLDELIAKKG